MIGPRSPPAFDLAAEEGGIVETTERSWPLVTRSTRHQTRRRSGGGPPRPSRASIAGDAASREWLERLRDAGPGREEAVGELHILLLSAARFTLAKRRSVLPQLRDEPLDDLANEAADDALVAVLAHLDDYRGQSRFTTWAWRFAFYHTSMTLRRWRWLGREIPTEDNSWQTIGREASPQRRLEQRELFAALVRAVQDGLTPHQRMVFVALALNDVPVDVVAERMQTTRGALYKTLHDARARLRAHLAASGLGPDECRPQQT
jgi:RNA polymerase sigma-70 factor (ECF subfamily)